MQKDVIKIRGARVHNLKNINVDIPKNKLVVICGVSGSGKSSLAFDTLYAEGQRRYVESLSSYARQFLGLQQKPDVDKIEGISPAIAIDQRKASNNPRSTVGTMTEIYDYLRVLFARIGVPHCPKCKRKVSAQTIDQMVEQVVKLKKGPEVLILGPVVRGKKGFHQTIIEETERAGFVRVRIDGIVQRVEEAKERDLDKQKKHNVEVVVDRLVLGQDLERSRLVDSLETALKLGKGTAMVFQEGKDLIFSQNFACEYCHVSLPEIEPRLFSFNSPFGACPSCQGLGKKLEVSPELVIPNKNLSLAEGAVFPFSRASHKVGRQGWFSKILEETAQRNGFSFYEPVKNLSKEDINVVLFGDGIFEGVVSNLERRFWETESEGAREEIKKYMVERQCEACLGKRLKPEALSVTILNESINALCQKSIKETELFFEKILKEKLLKESDLKIASPLVKEISERLGFLNDVGLDYLSLSRETETLSGGEEQRARLATQIGSKLTGVLYILDEPSIGLHPRDQQRLIKTLKGLRDVGNTVVVVEHDPLTIKESDFVVEIGPFAGKHGGKVVFEGTPQRLLKADTLTGRYLSGKEKVKTGKDLPLKQKEFLVVKGAKEHNLKNINVKIPLGNFVCVSGVSGSGKSTLVNDIIAKALYKKVYSSKEEPGLYKEMLGTEFLDKVVLVDQSPIGRTPRSNPATYTGAFNYVREIFSQVKEARVRGYKQGRFSFNVKGGRCEACEGQGVNKIEMYFLPDVYVECPECKGKRYNQETLSVEYKGKSIADVLDMTVEEAKEFFNAIPALYEKLKTLNEVGLGYVELGQPAPSLSGGEAQRVKLATELSKKATGKTLYILDEPTTGLHPYDIKRLLFVLKELVLRGNTVLAIEHNIDFIKQANWILDLGPEGGDKGGYMVAEGEAKDIVKVKASWTGKYLK